MGLRGPQVAREAAAFALPVAAEALDLEMPDTDASMLILGMSLAPLFLGQIVKIALGLRYKLRHAPA